MAPPSQDPEPGHGEDLRLVRGILGGEQRELARLSERLRCIARILRVLNLKHGCQLSDDELGDLVQDVLVIVWRKLPGYHGQVALEGWVYGICALELMNARRRKYRHGREVAEGTPEAESAPLPDPWAHEDLHRGLERIGAEGARVIRLKHFEERTFEEIGRLLDVSVNTVKARYYRGLLELKPYLKRREAP